MTRAQNDLNTTWALYAHEVYQLLKDVALGKRIMMRSSIQSWNEIYHGLMPVEIDGRVLTRFNDCDTLDYCEYWGSPDGRVGTLNSGRATVLILDSGIPKLESTCLTAFARISDIFR